MPRPRISTACTASMAVDPTEPASGKPYPYPPVSHEPRIQELHDAFVREGLHPFPLPLGVLLTEENGKPLHSSACVRCDAFDGFPCLVNGRPMRRSSASIRHSAIAMLR